MVMVRFSASGYGSSTSRHRTRQEASRAVEEEAVELSLDRGLEPAEAVFRGAGEWVVSEPGGEEIARWEIL